MIQLLTPAALTAGLASGDTDQILHAAEGISAYGWLLVALPMLGAAVLLLGGRRTNSWGPPSSQIMMQLICLPEGAIGAAIAGLAPARSRSKSAKPSPRAPPIPSWRKSRRGIPAQL